MFIPHQKEAIYPSYFYISSQECKFAYPQQSTTQLYETEQVGKYLLKISDSHQPLIALSSPTMYLLWHQTLLNLLVFGGITQAQGFHAWNQDVNWPAAQFSGRPMMSTWTKTSVSSLFKTMASKSVSRPVSGIKSGSKSTRTAKSSSNRTPMMKPTPTIHSHPVFSFKHTLKSSSHAVSTLKSASKSRSHTVSTSKSASKNQSNPFKGQKTVNSLPHVTSSSQHSSITTVPLRKSATASVPRNATISVRRSTSGPPSKTPLPLPLARQHSPSSHQGPPYPHKTESLATAQQSSQRVQPHSLLPPIVRLRLPEAALDP
jgi:hypothetical protein